MGSGPGIANQDGLELGPDLGPGQWPPCPRSASSSFCLLHFLDCVGIQANKWKPRLETYIWQLDCETWWCSHHPAACHQWICFKTNKWRELGFETNIRREFCLKTNNRSWELGFK